MKMRGVLAAGLILFGFATAEAASLTSPFLTGPADPSQTNATINGLVNAINAILSPLTGGGTIIGSTPGTGAVATNIIALNPGMTGSPAQIALQPGGDSNGSIQILPDLIGGDIILFGTGSTGGNLVIANAAMWVAASGLAACPGVLPGQGTVGAQLNSLAPPSTIQGYWIIEDWLDRVHYTPTC